MERQDKISVTGHLLLDAGGRGRGQQQDGLGTDNSAGGGGAGHLELAAGG